MALTIKQLFKSATAASTTSSFGLSQRSTTCQNPTPMDITNPTKQVDFISNNSNKTVQYYCHRF